MSKNNMLVVVILLTLGVETCFGAIAVEVPYQYAGYGNCRSAAYPDMGVMKIGDTKKVPDRCETATCDDGGYITFKGCGEVAPDFCTYPEPDHKKPYPECCPTEFVCNKNNLN